MNTGLERVLHTSSAAVRGTRSPVDTDAGYRVTADRSDHWTQHLDPANTDETNRLVNIWKGEL